MDCNWPWFLSDICSWLHSTGGSEQLWTYTFIHTSGTFQSVFTWILFFRFFESLIGVHVFGERSTFSSNHPISLLYVVKSFKKLQIKVQWSSRSLFLIVMLVLGLLNQLHIFWQLYLTMLLELLYDLVFDKVFGKVWHAGLLHRSSMELTCSNNKLRRSYASIKNSDNSNKLILRNQC